VVDVEGLGGDGVAEGVLGVGKFGQNEGHGVPRARMGSR